MVNKVIMPRLGWTMEAGTIVQWLKQDGELVQIGESLLEVEGDKAITEIEALDSGILRVPPDAPDIGVEVPVGTVLAYLVPVGEHAPFEPAVLSPDGRAQLAVAESASPVTTTSATVTPARRDRNGTHTPAISPRALRVAGELGVNWTVMQGTGSTGRIVERDVRLVAEAEMQPPAAMPQATETRLNTGTAPTRISPLARRAAISAGVDLDQVAASLPAQRITRADIAAMMPATPLLPTTAAGLAPTPLSPIRRITAARMAESAHTVAPVTLTTEADATELVRVRSQLASALARMPTDTPAPIPTPTYTDFLIRLTALALIAHPALNASLTDGGIVAHRSVHMGIAVDTERGLLVPVIRDTQGKSVRQIAAESAAQIAKTRAGRASADDLQGSTFTITNLGMYDIDAFTPIINLPECAILGVGRIVARAVVVDVANETIGVRQMVALSLTFDHRVVDGAPAARFLRYVKQCVEQPLLWLTQ